MFNKRVVPMPVGSPYQMIKNWEDIKASVPETVVDFHEFDDWVAAALAAPRKKTILVKDWICKVRTTPYWFDNHVWERALQKGAGG